MATFRSYRKVDGTTTVTARVRVAGHEDTRTFTTKTAARLWATKREAEIRNAPALASSEARKHTLSEAIARYRETVLPDLAAGTRTKYSQHLDWWAERYGHVRLDAWGPPQIAEARDRLRTEDTRRHGQQTAQKRSASTTNRYLASLAAVMAQAHEEWHWIPANPLSAVSKLREPAGRVRYLSEGELSALLQACEESEAPDLLPAVMVALVTGGRRMEVLGLRWCDLDLDAGTAVLSGQKTGYKRTVALGPDAVELLRARPRGVGRALVFPSPSDPGKPVDLRSAWTAALRRARVEDFRWHDLRHTCASFLAMEGATAAELAGVLGHKTLQMVGRYSHLSPAHVAQVSGRVAARIARRARP